MYCSSKKKHTNKTCDQKIANKQTSGCYFDAKQLQFGRFINDTTMIVLSIIFICVQPKNTIIWHFIAWNGFFARGLLFNLSFFPCFVLPLFDTSAWLYNFMLQYISSIIKFKHAPTWHRLFLLPPCPPSPMERIWNNWMIDNRAYLIGLKCNYIMLLPQFVHFIFRSVLPHCRKDKNKLTNSRLLFQFILEKRK